MTRLHASILLALLRVPALARPTPPEDPFDQERLKSGQALYFDKRYAEAIGQLRVAAFGYLNQPAALSETLVWLSLSQDAAGKAADAEATILRFVEVERSFPSYPPAALPAPVQAEFRSLLLRRVAEGTLLAVPSLAVLVETKEQKFAKLPPAERQKALESLARSEPNAAKWPALLARDAFEQGDSKAAERWATKALALEATNPDALAVRVRTRKARGDCSGALADLTALSTAEVDKRPDLYADKFVCLVQVGQWPAAEDVRKHVPQSLAGRNDVADAQRKLTSEEQRRASQSVAAAPAAKAAPPPARPPAPAAKGSTPPPSGPAMRSTPAPEMPARTVSEPSPADAAAASRAALAASRRLVLAGKAAEAERTLNDALRADPGNRDLRLALLEAACLNRSYKAAVAQLSLVEPLGDNEGPSLFYAAVALYETGHSKEARSYLGRAMPNVSGLLVDEYSTKILGQK